MRSFALWYAKTNDEDESRSEITVHINLWDKKNRSKKEYCFDFGFLIEDIRDIKTLYMYVPFEVDKEQIKDLGTTISNNKLVNAIFNENFTTTDGEPKRLIVSGNEDKSKFIIYSLEVESQIKISSCKRQAPTPGTILEIDIGGIKSNNIFKYYFRIRMQVKNGETYLINDEVKGISVFSNQFTNTEIIDFRLNDIRSCSEELREQFDKGEKFNILAIHYLILRNVDDVIIHYGKEINSRILEKNLWKSYIDEADNNIIAYHIKSKAIKAENARDGEDKYEYIENFSDLTRFQYKKSGKFIILMYVCGIIILGAIGGVLGNLISKKIGI